MANSSRGWRQNVGALVILYLLVGCSSGWAAEYRKESLVHEQERIDSLLASATPAVVAIKFGDLFGSSGVIISEDGLVLTHGHHDLSALQSERTLLWNREVSVALSDGRIVTARLMATHSWDCMEYSLLDITTQGKWPHVELSSRDCPQRGDWCLHLGHPLFLSLIHI